MKLPLERLKIERMASGDQSLRLTECVGWDAFPEYETKVM